MTIKAFEDKLKSQLLLDLKQLEVTILRIDIAHWNGILSPLIMLSLGLFIRVGPIRGVRFQAISDIIGFENWCRSHGIKVKVIKRSGMEMMPPWGEVYIYDYTP